MAQLVENFKNFPTHFYFIYLPACRKTHYYYYYYLSNLSIDWVAPKGIACSRVLPKMHTDIHITNTTKKTKTKLQNKNKL